MLHDRILLKTTLIIEVEGRCEPYYLPWFNAEPGKPSWCEFPEAKNGMKAMVKQWLHGIKCESITIKNEYSQVETTPLDM